MFLDTSGWLAAIIAREPTHAAAREAYAGQVSSGGALVTTGLVMAEMHALMLRFRGPAAALRFLDGVSADASHEIVDVDRDLRLAATERWLRRFVDHDFSLTDAVSFEVMRRLKIRRAIALDRHFAAAGFETVP